MAKAEVIYSYAYYEFGVPYLNAQQIEKRIGRTFKVQLKVDISHPSQSEAIISHLFNGEFVTLLHQTGLEVGLSRKLSTMSPVEIGTMQRTNQSPLLLADAVDNLMILGCYIVLP